MVDFDTLWIKYLKENGGHINCKCERCEFLRISFVKILEKLILKEKLGKN